MLSSFQSTLTKRALIKDKYVPYYVKWVSECYSFLDRPTCAILNQDCKQQFFRHLAKTSEDWQVKRAEQAWRLDTYFLSSQQKTPTGESHDAEAWAALATKTREVLRLRHRSYSTEKTYLTWLRSFRKFVNGTHPVCQGQFILFISKEAGQVYLIIPNPPDPGVGELTPPRRLCTFLSRQKWLLQFLLLS